MKQNRFVSALQLTLLIVSFSNTSAVLAEEPGSGTAPLWSLGGHFQLRYEGNEYTDLAYNRDFASLRLRTDFTFTPAKETWVVLTPQAVKYMGRSEFIGASATTNAAQVTSGQVYDTAMTLHQAYGVYQPFESVGLMVGRQMLAYGDEFIVGALDWQAIGRSFDAAKLKLHFGPWKADLFASKIVNNSITSSDPAVGDVNFFGFYNSFDLGDWAKATEVYLFDQLDSTAANSPKNLLAVGARLKSVTPIGLDYRLEAIKEFGNTVSDGVEAHALDLEVGYTLASAMNLRLAGQGFMTGKNYNQLYPTAHKWLGYADVLGRRNVSGFAAHAGIEPFQGFTTVVDFHYFMRTATDAPAYKLNGTTAIGNAGDSSAAIGSEVDLTFKYQVSKPLSFTLGGSLFFAGDYLRPALGDRIPGFYYASMNVKF